MRWRVLGTALASVGFLASLAVFLVGGFVALHAAGLSSLPTSVLLVGASLVAAVLVFRGVHDWTVLRWSNEPDPFLFGSFDLDRTLRRWRRVL